MRPLLITLFLLLMPGLAAAEVPARAIGAVLGVDGVQRVEIVAGGYFFDPFHLTVKVDTPVELRIRKEGGITPHNIVLRAPEAGIEFDEDLSNTPKIIRFTPTRAGTYPFYCSKRLLLLQSHRDRGMEGVLEVVD
jgi:plastocyanin